MVDTKPKQQTVQMTKEERKLAVLEAQKAKEKIFKLVVKIISWESGAFDSVVVQAADKITPEEWLEYKKHRQNIPTTMDEEKVKNKMIQTFNSIKANGGFE